MLCSMTKRVLFLAVVITLLSGCEITMPSLQFSSEGQHSDALGISSSETDEQPETVYAQTSTQGGDKPNKSEIEVAASGSPLATADYTGDEMSMEVEGMVPRSQVTNRAEYVPVMPVPRTSYQPAYTHKVLSDYCEQMAMNLLQKTKHITPNSRIAVASFVDFSQDLQSTSVLGNRLAESFMTELQSYGLAIIDYKVLPAIQVTANGDLFFERSGPRGEMQFVLTGTLQRNERGIEVNARIVNIYDQVVVATTRGFIPHFVVSSLTPDYVLMGSR